MISAKEAQEKLQQEINQKKELEKKEREKSFERTQQKFIEHTNARYNSVQEHLKNIEAKILKAIETSSSGSITYLLPVYLYEYYKITNKEEYINTGYAKTEDYRGKKDPLFVGVLEELTQNGYKVITEIEKRKEYTGNYNYEGGQIDNGPQYYRDIGEYVNLIISW